MAPTWEGDTSRYDTRDQGPGRGGRRGPSHRHHGDERHGGNAPWEFHHHHHHHHDHDNRPDAGRGRGGRRRERFGNDEEFGQALYRLIDAVRASGRSGEGSRHAAVAVMDGATRAIYRLLAEEAEAPADNRPAEAALSPESEAGPTAS
jgi:G3E family GTPase